MTDVSIIGLGAMGSALARVLLRNGHSITVWNRTSAKTDALVRDGAARAADLANAVAASRLVLVCVDNYAVTRDLLSSPDVRPNLAGRVLVQFSTGSPQEARDGEAWARDCGADYLDGAIWALPHQIGTPEAALGLSGSEAAFKQAEPLLRALADSVTYFGDKAGAAAALDCGAIAVLFGGLLGALHGARICEAEGLRVDEFGAMMADLIHVVGHEIRSVTEKVQINRFDITQNTLRMNFGAAMRLVQQARESGINADFPEYTSRTMEKGMSAGFADQDLAALIKVLRAAA